MAREPISRMSYAEYLAFEHASETKHEYVDGEVFARAGGTITHGALTVAVAAALSNALRDRRCRVLSSDVRIRSIATGLATYPDVTVVCQQIEIAKDDAHGVINPTVIVEVLSDSTESYDPARRRRTTAGSPRSVSTCGCRSASR